MTKKLLLAILSGILFSLAWTQWGFGWVLLFAFIPLFYIEEELYQLRFKIKSTQIFTYAYISFFVWNLISTWWVSNSTLFGGVAAVVLNSLFYTFLFWIFHFIKRRMGRHTGYSALIILWLAFENIYINGEISWVWLVLGNGFANNTGFIQWYEYTGTLGGSLWVLLANVLLFNLILQINKQKTLYGQYIFTAITLLVLIVPILVSKNIESQYSEQKSSVKVAIIQPNIDPYTEKFGSLSNAQQVQKMLDLLLTKGDTTADFFVLPETAVDDGIYENNFDDARSIRQIRGLTNRFPQSTVIFGATTRYLYEDGSSSITSRVYPYDTTLQYDIYNTAIQINSIDSLQKYHKSKLVIGVEMTPYPAFFNLFKDYIIDLGGTTGNLGRQEHRSVFKNNFNKAIIAPVICYESIYGEFVTEYVKAGANIIFIITNDAWWGDTPGYRQHLSFAKIRAIETRRSIVRCANTGISAIINQKGEIEKRTPYWEEAVLNGSVNINSELTYFVKNGDIIGRISKFMSLLLLLSVGLSLVRKNK